MTTSAHLPHSATLLQDAVFRQRTRRQRPLSSRVGCFDARKRSCGPNASPDGCSTPTLGHSGAGVESFRPRVSGDNGCDGSPFIYHSGEGVRCLVVADDFTDGAKHAQCRSTTGDRLTLVYSKPVTARRGECVVMMGGPVNSTMNRDRFFRVCLFHKGIFGAQSHFGSCRKSRPLPSRSYFIFWSWASRRWSIWQPWASYRCFISRSRIFRS